MLRAVPRHMFSWRFTVCDGDAEVADVRTAAFRERGLLTVNDVDCTIRREPGWGAFVLEADGHELVRAVKPSALVRRFEVTYEDQAYILQARSPLVRAFELLRDDERVGTIVPEHALTRTTRIDLPEELPVVVRVFLFWLVLVLWKRAAGSSG